MTDRAPGMPAQSPQPQNGKDVLLRLCPADDVAHDRLGLVALFRLGQRSQCVQQFHAGRRNVRDLLSAGLRCADLANLEQHLTMLPGVLANVECVQPKTKRAELAEQGIYLLRGHAYPAALAQASPNKCEIVAKLVRRTVRLGTRTLVASVTKPRTHHQQQPAVNLRMRRARQLLRRFGALALVW